MSTHTVASACFASNHEHIAAELEWLDMLLRLRVQEFRHNSQSRAEQRGHHLFIADEDVDWMLGGIAGGNTGGVGAGARFVGGAGEGAAMRRALVERQAEIAVRVAGSAQRGTALGLPQLGHLFSLSRFELQAVVICLAPELRRRYDRIYAYLQDDITRKRPSIDLVIDLLCDTEESKWNARALLAPHATLFHLGLLQTVDDPQSPSGSSGLAQFVRLDPRILQFILGQQMLDDRLSSLVYVRQPEDAEASVVDPDTRDALLGFIGRWSARPAQERERVVVHLHGRRGSGRHQLALDACATLGCALLELDARRLPGHPDEAEPLLRLALRESLLLQAPLLIAPASVFLREGDQSAALRSVLARTIQTYGWLIFLAGEESWPHRDLFGTHVFQQIAVPKPSLSVRESAWRRALGKTLQHEPADELVTTLAARFCLTPGQIRQAASEVAHGRLVADTRQPIRFEDITAACRAQAQHDLDALATRVEQRHGWEDLIQPADKLAQLHELCSQVRYQSVVYDRWGFGRRLARGRGISALFSGPPGTGKTMAAEVIAGELQLDLYKIDLARVVSKYIGETEKNLARIFSEAEDSNTVLFFDEADALFGKRTEISDAHDRYANIETSYLLQRMEEYSGIVILASNLCDNMDEAFLRRIRFLIDFPFPDAASRHDIWKAHFPAAAPCGDIAWEELAGRFQVAGGNIRNIVLAAAFFAAANGGVIEMEHVLRGARREFEKIGKLWDEATHAGLLR
jgi:hypothetical protein